MREEGSEPSRFGWRLHLLGRAELVGPDGAPVRLPTRFAFLVLAALCVESGEPWSRVDLAEAVWGDKDRERSRASLRTALNFLRRVLPDGTLVTDSTHVAIRQGSISCDADDCSGLDGYLGDFMPGFDTPWVNRIRSAFQRSAGDDAVRRAREQWAFGARDEAVTTIERACAIDPLNSAAVDTRVTFLEELGKAGDAQLVAANYRAQMQREIESVEPPARQQSAPTHPLVSAAEWVLARNPEEAVAMLASTRTQWMSLPLDKAIDIHQRILAGAKARSSARSVVEAQFILLSVLAGRAAAMLGRLRTACEAAVAAGDGETASILTSALAYAFLSNGEFNAALKYGRLHAELADISRDYKRQIEGQVTLGIIEQHSGRPTQGFARAKAAIRSAEESGSSDLISSVGPLHTVAMLFDGNVEGAQENVERYRKILEAAGNERMRPWILMGMCEVSEAAGELEAAREAGLTIRRLGITRCGHSAVAMAEDKLTRINWKLREYDLAAEAFARASLVRKLQQAQPSIFERAETREVRAELKARIGMPALRAAYRQAALDMGTEAEN